MSTDVIIDLKNQIMDLADVIAAAALRLQKPAADEITMRQAWDEFDRTWLGYQIVRNRIKGRRKGPHKNSPIMFSRAEILALKEAERMAGKVVIK